MGSTRTRRTAFALMLIIQLTLSYLAVTIIGANILRPTTVMEEQRVIVLSVWSEDTPPDTSIGEIQTAMDRVSDYFEESSYSQVHLTSDVMGWTKLSQSMSFYASSFSIGVVEHGSANLQLVMEAISINENLVDFSRYDRLVVVHSGHGRQEASGSNSSLIGSCNSNGWFPTSDGRIFQRVSILSEYDSMKTYAHEIGHDFGAVDLYDYESNRSSITGISYWGIMSSGSDVHMCAFNKLKIGWLQQQDFYLLENGSKIVELVPISCQNRGYRAIRYNLPDGRYFIVEARSNEGYDEGLPDYGVLIMLVNESRLDERKDGVQLQVPVQSQWLSDASLRAGETYFDAENSFAVQVLEWTDELVTVKVSNELQEDWVTSERFSLDSDLTLSDILVTTVEPDGFTGGYETIVFAAAVYWNDTHYVAEFYRSDGSIRNWEFMTATNLSGYGFYSFRTTFCYYKGSLFLIGRIIDSESNFIGSINYHLSSDSFTITNFTEMVDYPMWDAYAVSGREALYVCGTSRKNGTQGITYFKLKDGQWNNTFHQAGTYLRISNVIDDSVGPLILYREDVNFTLNLIQFNSSDIQRTWMSTSDMIMDFDIVCSKDKIYVAYHEGVENATYSSRTLHVLAGTSVDELNEIFSEFREGRMQIKTSCYKNGSRTYHMLKWMPGNVTEYIFQNASLLSIRPLSSSSYAMPKIDLTENEYRILFTFSYSGPAISNVAWSWGPSNASEDVLYYFETVQPFTLLSLLLLFPVVAFVVTYVAFAKRQVILRIKEGSPRSTLGKIRERLPFETLTRLRLFLVRPYWLMLNIAVATALYFSTRSFSSLLIVAIFGNAFNVLLISWLIAIVLTFSLGIWGATGLEMAYTRSDLLFDTISEQIGSTHTELVNVLRIVHTFDPSVTVEIAFDELLSPTSELVQEIKDELIVTVGCLRDLLETKTRKELDSCMLVLYPDFLERLEPKRLSTKGLVSRFVFLLMVDSISVLYLEALLDLEFLAVLSLWIAGLFICSLFFRIYFESDLRERSIGLWRK